MNSLSRIQTNTQTLQATVASLNAQQTAIKAMKAEQKKFDLSKVEKMQDEMEDLLYKTEEIQATVGRSYDLPNVDEDELDAELDALGDELWNEPEANSNPSYLSGVGAELEKHSTPHGGSGGLGLPDFADELEPLSSHATPRPMEDRIKTGVI